ncbi:MAG: hypothetical protein K0S71_1093 [Clostridia bacterium]|jgi:predicted NBD/HSP70 family sugar kinase|nr:hypothetical protein [Clostridia bacterium]
MLLEHIGGNALVIKEVNINLVRKVLKEKGQATKQQIAEETGLSTVTVGSVLQQLIKENEVFEAELSSSRGGRPAKQFQYNNDFALVLTLFPYEAEGNIVIHCMVANLSGESIFEKNEEVSHIDLESLEHMINPLMSTYPAISAIGIGLPAVESNGKIVVSDYKALIGISLTSHFNDLYQRPVIIENDVNAAVVGFVKRKELIRGHAVVYLYFPDKYPPGAGIFIDGKLYRGKGNFAGEVSNIPVGVSWSESLYQSFEELCDAIAKLIIIMSSVLSPEHIVLSGHYINQTHVNAIIQGVCSHLPQNIMPSISLSENYIDDYALGMIEETLEILEPDIVLTRK